MTLTEALGHLRSRWPVVLAFVVLGLLVASLVVIFVPRKYESSIVLYIAAQSQPDNSQAAYQGSLLSEQRVKSYTELATGDRVADDIITRLGLPDTPRELAEKITATSATDTVLLTISVTDSDPELAARVANAVGDSMMTLVTDLEQPSVAGRPAAVFLRSVERASPSTDAVSPNVPLCFAAGFLLGLVAGIGVVLLRVSLDTSIKRTDSALEVEGMPLLGEIMMSEDVRADVGKAWESLDGRVAEAFRHIRTSIQFVDVDGATNTFIVTSANAGEGKTTVSCNLAYALAASSSSVLLVDGDLRRPGASEYLGVEPSVGLTTVLSGRAQLDSAIQRPRPLPFDVLACGVLPPNPSELLGSRSMQRLIEEAGARYDYVLIDAPPALPVTDASVLSRFSDGIVLVARESGTKQKDFLAAADLLRNAGGQLLGVVLNMTAPRRSRAYEQYSYSSVKREPAEMNARSSGDTDLIRAGNESPRPTPTPRRR